MQTRRSGTMTEAARTSADGTRRQAPGWRRVALRLAGPGLLIASGAIHLDLYLTGYRSIPTIGWLFLLQVIAAFVLGLAAAGLRSWLAPAAAAGFCLATLGGYILSVWIGLFGFKEVRTTAGIVAGLLEVAAFAALATLALTLATAAAGSVDSDPATGPRRLGAIARMTPATVKAAGMASAGLAAVALVLFGVSVAGAGGQPPVASHGALKTVTIHGTSVLANAKGFTLYWFAPDTASASKCYGSCAAYWPPVTGTATAGPGVTGKFGTIKRTGGATQVSYDGHPLYTYIGDSAPGQASGNNLNLNGGLWHEMTVSGS
jgi:predicted lipoprotein with Yx(FWY)xxD motif